MAGSGGKALGFSPLAVMGATTVGGAIGSELSGSDWHEGAIQGMNIGAYNHGWITNDDGIISYEFNEVTVIGNKNLYSERLIAYMIYSARMANRYRSQGMLTLYDRNGTAIREYNASSGSGSGKVARTLPAGHYSAYGYMLITNEKNNINLDIGITNLVQTQS